MDQDMKARWVAALRSGEYKQGRTALRVTRFGDPEYCCLGVLCEILPDVDYQAGDFTRDGVRVGAYGTLRSDEDEGIGGLPHFARLRLANMNDDGKSFAEIADYIEAIL